LITMQIHFRKVMNPESMSGVIEVHPPSLKESIIKLHQYCIKQPHKPFSSFLPASHYGFNTDLVRNESVITPYCQAAGMDYTMGMRWAAENLLDGLIWLFIKLIEPKEAANKQGEARYMKRESKHIPADFTGSVDELIFYRHKANGKIYARKRFTFKNHPGQAPFASAQKAIYALQPSQAYRQNLSDYLIGYNKLKINDGREVIAWTNLYNKLMFAMQKQLGIALTGITREMIVQQNLPCQTVKAAVEAGLLPKVPDYERFNQPI